MYVTCSCDTPDTEDTASRPDTEGRVSEGGPDSCRGNSYRSSSTSSGRQAQRRQNTTHTARSLPGQRVCLCQMENQTGLLKYTLSYLCCLLIMWVCVHTCVCVSCAQCVSLVPVLVSTGSSCTREVVAPPTACLLTMQWCTKPPAECTHLEGWERGGVYRDVI